MSGLSRVAIFLCLMMSSAVSACAGDLQVKTWATPYAANEFPEAVNEGPLKVEHLDDRAAFGIAFSGGGTRAASAALGQLRALTTLGWMDQAKYVSAVSGGSWTVVPYIYLPEEADGERKNRRSFTDQDFLGDYRSTRELRLGSQTLGQAKNVLECDVSSRMALAISSSNLIKAFGKSYEPSKYKCEDDALVQTASVKEVQESVGGKIAETWAAADEGAGTLERAWRWVKHVFRAATAGDELYARLLGPAFLAPFDLYKPSRFFTQDEESLDQILKVNGSELERDNFILAREKRPFLIVGGTLLHKPKEDDAAEGRLTKTVDKLRDKLGNGDWKKIAETDRSRVARSIKDRFLNKFDKEGIYPLEITPLF